MRRISTAILGFSLAILIGGVSATNAGPAPAPCDEGGPCTCGELYNLDRCSGIGGETCGCGTGFTGPSLGPTSDCSVSFPSNSCCLPTGETYATACLGRVQGAPCTSSAQCADGSCVAGVCGPGSAALPAPVFGGAAQLMAVVAALLGHVWWWRRARASAL